MHHTLAQPLPEDLQCLHTRLQEEKYQCLESLCKKVAFCIAEVQLYETHDTTRIYTGLCTKLNARIAQYMRLRRLVLVPYIHDLLEKEDIGHDCRACGGGCSIRHAEHVTNIREAHAGMRELLYQLQAAAIPLYRIAEHSEVLRALQRNMIRLDTVLTELFFIEESTLIPMMIELQQTIGAHG